MSGASLNISKMKINDEETKLEVKDSETHLLLKICRNFNVQSCSETSITDHELQLCITENKLNTIFKKN